MDTGDHITIRLNTGQIVQDVVLDDRVYPDATYGQYDSGWWAFVAGTENDDDDYPYFISATGEVWDTPDNINVGTVVP
jgi:hypothetical protein